LIELFLVYITSMKRSCFLAYGASSWFSCSCWSC
jgi:hypothetical protein